MRGTRSMGSLTVWRTDFAEGAGLDGLDAKARTVTVGAGITYGRLAPYIDSRGYAVHNLASLPHVSVVGACSTATHGSGVKNGNLSTAVASDRDGDGGWRDRRAVAGRRWRDDFAGAVVGLGALGVVTKITLDVEPTFQVRQVVYENLSMDAVGETYPRDLRERLQCEPIHRLAESSDHAGVVEA